MDNLVSLKEISTDTLHRLFNIIDSNDYLSLNNRIMGTAFFQSSTRTRLSFESAMFALGGKNIGFSDMHHSRCLDNYFQETLEDFVRVIAQMVDFLVIRHFTNNVPSKLSSMVDIPIVNAGDGTNEHPTQALQDIWLMQKKAGALKNKVIAFTGDISRNFRSMSFGLAHFGVKKLIYLLPPGVTLPDDIKNFLKQKIPYELYTNLSDVLVDADFINTFTPALRDLENNNKQSIKYIRILEEFIINQALYKKTNSHAYILSAGPRTYEISTDMDNHPNFIFLEQVRSGVRVRKGIISLLLSKIEMRQDQKNKMKSDRNVSTKDSRIKI